MNPEKFEWWNKGKKINVHVLSTLTLPYTKINLKCILDLMYDLNYTTSGEEYRRKSLCTGIRKKNFREHIKTWPLKEKIDRLNFVKLFFFKDSIKKMTRQA